MNQGDWATLADKIAGTGLLGNSSTIAIPPTSHSALAVRASTGTEPLFQLSDDVPGQQRPGVDVALKNAGRADFLGFVSTHGRLPSAATLPKRLRTVLAA